MSRWFATVAVVALWITVAGVVIWILPSTEIATPGPSPGVSTPPIRPALTSASIQASGRGGPMDVRISYGTIGQGNLLDETIVRLPIEDAFLVDPIDDVWLTVKPVDPDRRVVCSVSVDTVGQVASNNRELPWCRVRVRGWVAVPGDGA